MANTKIDATQLSTDSLSSHYIKLQLSGVQNVAAGTYNALQTLNWDATNLKSPNNTSFHNTASSNDKIYPQVAGIWLFTAQIRFASDPSALRAARINLNGASKGHAACVVTDSSAEISRIQVTAMVRINTIGVDYVSVEAGHDAGSALSLGSGENDTWVHGLLVRRL